MVKENSTFVYYDRNLNEFVGLDSEAMDQLRETYDGVDIETELKKMCLWLRSKKGVKRKGNIGFILNWLNNSRKSPPPVADLPESDSPLAQLVENYLMDFRENCSHIYQFNTLRAKK